MARGESLTFKTLLLSFGKVIVTLSALIISVVLARFLSIEGYAVHKKAILAFTLVSPVLMLGLPKALYFFLPESKKGARTTLVANLVLLSLSGAIFAAGLVFVFGDVLANYLGDPTLVRFWWIVSIYGFAMLPLSALSATLVAQSRVKVLVRFQMTSQLLLVGAVSFVAWKFGEPIYTLGAFMGWSVLAVAIALVLMLKSTPQSPVELAQLRTQMKDQLVYAVPLGLASMFGSVSIQLDKLMVSQMCSTEEFSWYVAQSDAIALMVIKP